VGAVGVVCRRMLGLPRRRLLAALVGKGP
jgi:hypothetical protein